MPLQIDATLLYNQDPALTPFGELRQIDTPYNTYLHAGLPPTPIANPGRASIQAALQPGAEPAVGRPDLPVELPDPSRLPAVPYYVLANEDGGHAFAATLEQHEAQRRSRSRRRAPGVIIAVTTGRDAAAPPSSARRCGTACRPRSTTPRSRRPGSTG